MASSVTAAGSPASSADSYIGRLLSIVSKSEMRYEGVLYYINPHDATFGLKSVKSFGTEGRRKDGPQVFPDGRVFEYIQFRGTDIKDLQVLPTLAPQDTSSVLDDPAIIQSHYTPPGPKSTSAQDAASVGVVNLSSNGGLQNAAVKDSFPLFPPVNLASIGTLLPPPSAQMNASAMLPHVQGLGDPLTGIPYVQQQSLVGSQGLPTVYAMKQQLQYPAFNSFIPNSTPNLDGSSQSLMLPVTLGSLISTPNLITPSAFPLNSAPSNSLVTPNAVSDSKPSSLPTFTLSPTLPSVSPMTATLLERHSIIPPVIDKTNLVIASGLQKENAPGSFPSADGPSTASNPEELKPSSVAPCQFLQTGPTNCLSSRSPESASEDVEVVKVLTSESHQTSSKETKASVLELPTASATKHKDSNTFRDSKKPHQRGRGDMRSVAYAPIHKYVKSDAGLKKMDGAYTRPRQIRNSGFEEKGLKKDGTDPKSQESMRGSAREDNLRSSQTLKHGESYGQERGKKWSGAASRWGTVGSRRGGGRVASAIRQATKFTEDFDFDAMNKKFNKDELWGDLGKNRKVQMKGKADAGEEDAIEGEHAETVNLDMKPVYVKDDFFDSLSSDQADHKLFERRKIDKETFGDLKLGRGNHGLLRAGRGSQSKGSSDGRGYGNAGRGRGKVQAVWTRVT